MGEIIFNGEVIFFGGIRNTRRRYDVKEVLRVSRSSVLNNVRGLVGVFSGNLVKLKRVRVGDEERKIEIVNVRVGDRLISYRRYEEMMRSDGRVMGNLEELVNLLRGWQR